MKMLALGLLVALAQTPAQTSSPGDCLAAAKETTARQQKAMAPLTADKVKQINAEVQAQATACAAKIAVASLSPADRVSMAELYTFIGQPQQATALTDALLADASAPADVRGRALFQKISTILTEPKGEERNARLEALSDALDAIGPAAFDSQFSAHSRLNSYYRGDDIDAGIIKHSTWILNAAKSFTPEQHARLDRMGVAAPIDMAEALAGQGMNDQALALLAEGKAMFGKAALDFGIDDTIARYKLVGGPAAPVTAPQWFNGPAIPFDGKVTLLEFTAHWCGPCRESYPGINRLRAKYGAQGFQVGFVTRLYGYFGTERTLDAATETTRDKDYFAEHHFADVPVAIGPKIDIKVVNGQVVYLPEPDPNDVHYKVSGIPQIHLIDKHGRIRLIMVGYDDANEPKLAKMIEDMLNEK